MKLNILFFKVQNFQNNLKFQKNSKFILKKNLNFNIQIILKNDKTIVAYFVEYTVEKFENSLLFNKAVIDF